MAVAAFRGNIATKRPLFEELFRMMRLASEEIEPLQQEMASWLDDPNFGASILNDPFRRETMWQTAAHQNLNADTGATIVLLAVAELDRLHRKTGISLFERGPATHAGRITLTRALYALGNQFKHYGKWVSAPDQGQTDREVVAELVGDPLQQNAASLFLLREFAGADHLTDALISCGNGIADDGRIPTSGVSSVPRITMSWSPTRSDTAAKEE